MIYFRLLFSKRLGLISGRDTYIHTQQYHTYTRHTQVLNILDNLNRPWRHIYIALALHYTMSLYDTLFISCQIALLNMTNILIITQFDQHLILII